MMHLYYDKVLEKRLDKVIPNGAGFFPFRVSDPSYCATKAEQYYTLVITDPSHSARVRLREGYLDISAMHECKKTLYMTMLHLMQNRKDIRIPLYEDVTSNYHISIVEMIYYVPNNIDFHYRNIQDLESLYIIKGESNADH